MIRKLLLPFFLFVGISALISCGENAGSDQSDAPEQQAFADADSVANGSKPWTYLKLVDIWKDYELGTDSSAVSPVDDPNFEEYREYRQGVLKRKLIRSKDGRPLYEYLYGPNGWELRKIYCGNGQENFVGVAKDGEFYGLSQWWYCDGKPEHAGYRYKGKKFGTWTYYKEDGSVDHIEDFGMPEYMDSVRIALTDQG